LPALLERIAIDVAVVVAVRVPTDEWEIPDGDLKVMGEAIPVTEDQEVLAHEVEMLLTDGRNLVFDVYYPATNRAGWAKLFGSKQEERWIDDGGNNSSAQ